MLENSLWHRYHETKSIRETLSTIYGCDEEQLSADESLLYAAIKRSLTKKELRLFIMKEAGMDDAALMQECGLNEEELGKSLKKAYHKLRNKVRAALKEADAQ